MMNKIVLTSSFPPHVPSILGIPASFATSMTLLPIDALMLSSAPSNVSNTRVIFFVLEGSAVIEDEPGCRAGEAEAEAAEFSLV
jgi:hypothetical protein